MKSVGAPLPAFRSARLPDQVRERIRYLHCSYSIRTEESCVHWVRAFKLFYELKSPPSMDARAVRSPLDALAATATTTAATA